MNPAQKFLLFLLLICSAFPSSSQVQVGVFGGLATYNGDLLDKLYSLNNGAFGITVGYAVSERFIIRGGMTVGKVAGADSVSSKYFVRNLSFRSGISEISITGEYRLLNIDENRLSLFVFPGLALFHFNPYSLDKDRQKFYLKPLSTEGQGLSQYPQQKPYSLTQLAVPVGGGLRYALSERTNLAIQIGVRILFTDYLDDVSTIYVNSADLLAAKGARAVELAYRGGEIPGGNPLYPKQGTPRGGSTFNDFYYFSGLHFTFQLGDGRGDGVRERRRRYYDCPPVLP